MNDNFKPSAVEASSNKHRNQNNTKPKYSRGQKIQVVVAIIGLMGLIIAALINQGLLKSYFEYLLPKPFHPIPIETHFAPAGWMGDGEQGERYISLSQVDVMVNGVSKAAYKIEYRTGGTNGWAGIYWLYKDWQVNKGWGNEKGISLIGAREIVFYARGESDGEVVEFLSGGVKGKYPDTYEKVSTGNVVLSTQWKQYSISLVGKDLSNVGGAFAWSTRMPPNGRSVFYISDIQIR